MLALRQNVNRFTKTDHDKCACNVPITSPCEANQTFIYSAQKMCLDGHRPGLLNLVDISVECLSTNMVEGVDLNTAAIIANFKSDLQTTYEY